MKAEDKNYKYRANANDIRMTSSAEVKVMNIAMTQQSKRKIDIITRYLDKAVFDVIDFIDSVKQLSISSPNTRIRILIRDSDPMVKNGHRMIELIQQLTSTIEVRMISEEYQSYNEAFMIYDTKAVIYLRYSDRYDGVANFDRPRLATELSAFFEEVWERSLPDPNLRRLHI